jgi:lipoate-protein ligase A
MMVEEIFDGTFEDTIAVFRFTDVNPTFLFGTFQDVDLFDLGTIREHGFQVGRRFQNGGGAGFFTPATPVVRMWFRDPETRNADFTSQFDRTCEASVAALERLGLEAEYEPPIGDTEVIKDGNRYKTMAPGIQNDGFDNHWKAVCSIIYDAMDEAFLEVMDEAVSAPPEKFEDKDTDSLTTRMLPLSTVFEESGLDVGKEKLIDTVIEEIVRAFVGEGADIYADDLSKGEREYIVAMEEYYRCSPWLNTVSTRRMCQRAPTDYRVGTAAYKTHKLIKANLVLDERDRIHDINFSGDFYLRPGRTMRNGQEGLAQLNNQLRGLDPSDELALEGAVEDLFSDSQFEIPSFSVQDIVKPVLRADQNTQPVEEYIRETA